MERSVAGGVSPSRAKMPDAWRTDLNIHSARNTANSAGRRVHEMSEARKRWLRRCMRTAAATLMLKLSENPCMGISTNASACSIMKSDAPENSVPITRATGWSRGKVSGVCPDAWGEVTTSRCPCDLMRSTHACLALSAPRCR